MADYGVAVIWGEPKGGREKKGLDLFADVTAQYDKAVADGRLERWDVVIFEPSGTPPNGAMRLFGSQQQIEDYIRSEEFQQRSQQAGLLLHAFGLKRFVTGAALTDALGSYTSLVDSL